MKSPVELCPGIKDPFDIHIRFIMFIILSVRVAIIFFRQGVGLLPYRNPCGRASRIFLDKLQGGEGGGGVYSIGDMYSISCMDVVVEGASI